MVYTGPQKEEPTRPNKKRRKTKQGELKAFKEKAMTATEWSKVDSADPPKDSFAISPALQTNPMNMEIGIGFAWLLVTGFRYQ